MTTVDSGPSTSTASTRNDDGVDLAADLHVDPSSPQVRVDLHDPTQRAAVEAAVTSVPGVIGARLVAGFERQVDELHVLTVIDRSAKQTVRDVQTVLMARYNVPTDHRVVSVVQLEEGQGLAPLPTRPAIEEVGVVRAGTTVEASVVVVDRDTSHRGTATGAATPTGRHRSVAHATLAALRPLLAEHALVELEGVDVMDVASHRLAVVVLQIRSPRTEIVLSGTAMVHDTSDDAIARAILDALNRTLADPPS
jgi:hypothetical protein